MNKNRKRLLAFLWACALLLFLFFMVSCSSLNPFPKVPEVLPSSVYKPPANQVTGTVSDLTDTAKSWAWLSIILVFFFPKMREPLVHLLTSVANTISIPFDFLTDKYSDYRINKRYKNKDKNG